MKIVLVLVLTVFTAHVNAESVREWWVKCHGNDSQSTCLSEEELAKFKTICSHKSSREDCQKVIAYTMARTRISEGKAALLSGYASQVSNFSAKKKYLDDVEKIWDQDKIDSSVSFAVGLLPSCAVGSNKKLVFGKNPRPEFKQFQKQALQIYEALSAMPCPDIKNGFVLVTIGKVDDSNNQLEVFTIDEKKNFTVIHSALRAGIFASK